MFTFAALLFIYAIPASVSTIAPTPNLGECPPLVIGLAGICLFDPAINCIYDTECPWGYRCCPQGCNKICKAVTVNGQHPGSCENATGDSKGICKEDRHCQPYEKCCDRVGIQGCCKQVRPPTAPPNTGI